MTEVEAVVLSLTKARTELGAFALERHLAEALSLPESKVTVMIDDDAYDIGGCTDTTAITIIAYPEQKGDNIPSSHDMANKLNDTIQRGEAQVWTSGKDATCNIADDEESVIIEEEEAFQLWREMSEESRTGHLDEVPSPDGVMIQPTNDNAARSERSGGGNTNTRSNCYSSPIDLHMKRDPFLLDYDNVKRVHVSQIHNVSWKEPFIITNAIADEKFESNEGVLNKHRLINVHGEEEVRTGNRETLINNGITNSKPMLLSDALFPADTPQDNNECGRIVFSPVAELSNDFTSELKSFTDCFPDYYSYSICNIEEPSPATDSMNRMTMNKFTLTLASEGFGIGMHKHNVAMFMLIAGRKKWYMRDSEFFLSREGGSSDTTTMEKNTHPGFYRELSSHKCIQQPGEILFVPEEWYHEIFNLGYTAGIQALP